MPKAPTSTIRDVELVSAGTWAASTGVTVVTRADLEAMLTAAADTDLDAPAVRIGHVDPRFDGEPAAGWVQPTRVVEQRKDGKQVPTLLGNIVGMPSKLAEVAPVAFRRRSVEIAWGVKTAAGKRYAAVLTGLALLGVSPPAVKGLADVLALYSQGQPPTSGLPERVRATVVELVDGLDDNPVAVAMLTAARTAGATPEVVDAIAVAAGARDTATIPPPTQDATHDGRVEPDPPTGGPPMPRTLTDAELREMIGKEADVDVEATIAAIRAEGGTQGGTGEGGDGGTTGDPAKGTAPPGEGATTGPATGTPAAPPADTPAGTPAPPAGPEGTLVTLSADTLAQLQADGELGRNAATELAGQRRNRILDDAIRTGRITPAERAAFGAQLDRDEEGTTTLLSGLAPRYAVTALGDPTAPDATPDDKAFDEFQDSLGLDIYTPPTS